MAHGDTEQLAAYLRMLKDRAGRSFDALGRRAGVSGSTLHRYCAGTSVPTSFDSIFAFARVCGASREEMRELQRLWALADARRETSRTATEPDPAPEPGPGPATADAGAAGGGTAGGGANDAGAAGGGAAGGGAAGGGEAAPDGPTNADPRDTAEEGRAAAEEGPGTVVPGNQRRRPWLVALMAAGAVVLLLAGTAWAVVGFGDDRSGGRTGQRDDRLLFSPGCRQVVGMGQHDECVREVQSLLKAAGARLSVDGDYGPETLRRVTAFQVLAGLPPKGVVDDATKQALYDRKVSMETWPAARVEQRIREVFVEQPDRAVAIADCQSYLDPLWVLPNTNGTRNWGVFQISDTRLAQFRATPQQALDPDWNIKAAYELWKQRPDFSDWPHCARGARVSPPPAGSPTAPPAPSGRPSPAPSTSG